MRSRSGLLELFQEGAFDHATGHGRARSVSTPKDRAATLAARSHRDGDELLRLRTEGAMRFDRLRRDGVGALIRAPLRLMPVKVGLINSTGPVTGLVAPSASGTAPPEPSNEPTARPAPSARVKPTTRGGSEAD